jgi:hypothetical protein
MIRIVKLAWESYRQFLGLAVVGMLLSAIWAAFGNTSALARFLPLGFLVAIFVCYFGWAAWQFSISRDLKIAKQVKALEFSRRTTLHINSDGDLDVQRSLLISNKSSKPISTTIDEKLGYELNANSENWSPNLELLTSPAGKEITRIYTYRFDHDKPLIPGYEGKIRTVCWGFQIRPYLEPEEEATIEYRIPRSPATESAAFTQIGSHITLVPERLYSKVTHSVHAPPGFRFEVFDIRVIAPDDQREHAEEVWIRRRCPPYVDKDDAGFLRWEIDWPIPGYRYSIRYRLLRVGSTANPPAAADASRR